MFNLFKRDNINEVLAFDLELKEWSVSYGDICFVRFVANGIEDTKEFFLGEFIPLSELEKTDKADYEKLVYHALVKKIMKEVANCKGGEDL